MTSYFADLYKNNAALSTDDRKRLVLSTGGLLVFDPLFSNKDVHVGLLANLLNQYKWIWIRLNDDTDIVVNDVDAKQGAVNTWVQYYDPKPGQMARILFSELVKKIDPVNAAESVVRMSRVSGEGRVYYENKTKRIDHNQDFKRFEEGLYAVQYRKVEKDLQELNVLLHSKPQEVLDKIWPLLYDCYIEYMFYEDARREIEEAQASFTSARYSFHRNSDATNIVDRYMGYLKESFHPNIGWFHTLVFEDFIEIALFVFQQALQARFRAVSSDINGTKALKYEQTWQAIEKVLVEMDEKGTFPIEKKITITNRVEDKGRFYYKSFFPDASIALPISVLAQEFMKKEDIPLPQNKQSLQSSTLLVRKDQSDLLTYTRWLNEQLETGQKLDFQGLDMYNFKNVRERLIMPLHRLLTNNTDSLVKFSKHPVFSPDAANLPVRSDAYLLRWILDYYKKYLNAYTLYVPAEVADPHKLPSQYNYLTSSLPVSLDGRMNMDCFMYAILHAYMMPEVMSSFELKLHYVIMPFHIGVMAVHDINDPVKSFDKSVISFQNGNINTHEISAEKITELQGQMKCSGNNQDFFGQLASIDFQGGLVLSLPFRYLAVSTEDPKENTLWKQAATEIPAVRLFKLDANSKWKKFPLLYASYYGSVKKFRNEKFIPFWNNLATMYWNEYQKTGDFEKFKKRMEWEWNENYLWLEKRIRDVYKKEIEETYPEKWNEIFDAETSVYCKKSSSLLIGDLAEMQEFVASIQSKTSLHEKPFFVSGKLPYE